MFRQLISSIVGPFMVAGVTSALTWDSLPLPDDAPHVYAMGPDPDRILLFGGGSVAGVGVTSHELGLGGQLARALSAMTGRGADIEIDGQASRSNARSARDLAGIDLSRYDAVILALGSRQAIALRSERVWSREIRSLIKQLEATTPATLALFLVAIQPLPHSSSLTPTVYRIVERHTARLNQASMAACAGTRLQFLVSPPREIAPGSRYGPASAFAASAASIALGVKNALDSATAGIREAEIDDEALRVNSLEELVALGDTRDTRFDSIVGMARALFGVSGAALTFIDRDSQWTHAGAGIPRGVIPREGTFCAETISRDEIAVVEDTDLDPRFVGHAYAVGNDRVRFYAGYPIEAPNGQRIGSLCIVDVAPREFSAEDSSLLRELALRVQSALWASTARSRSRL